MTQILHIFIGETGGLFAGDNSTCLGSEAGKAEHSSFAVLLFAFYLLMTNVLLLNLLIALFR